MMIAGVVGIASVLMGILYYQPQLFAVKEPYSAVRIERLEDTYLVDEPIDFIVTVKGYGCDAGFPSVYITTSTDEMVWSRIGEVRLFPAGYSCPNENIYQVRHIGDFERYGNDEQERRRIQGGMPIVMNSEGKYVVHVKDGTVPATKRIYSH